MDNLFLAEEKCLKILNILGKKVMKILGKKVMKI